MNREMVKKVVHSFRTILYVKRIMIDMDQAKKVLWCSASPLPEDVNLHSGVWDHTETSSGSRCLFEGVGWSDRGWLSRRLVISIWRRLR